MTPHRLPTERRKAKRLSVVLGGVIATYSLLVSNPIALTAGGGLPGKAFSRGEAASCIALPRTQLYVYGVAYQAGTVKVIVGGTLPGGETFAWGYQCLGDPSMTQTQLDSFQGGFVAALTNNFLTTGVKALFSTNTTYRSVKSYLYGGGSNTILQSLTNITPVSGSSASAALPNQCAIVVTLKSGIPGRSNRGRAYLPMGCAGILANDGQLTSTQAGTIATAFASMLTAVKSGIAPIQPVVASPTHGSSKNLVSVSVDTRFDVQRRRARSQVADSVAQASI